MRFPSLHLDLFLSNPFNIVTCIGQADLEGVGRFKSTQRTVSQARRPAFWPASRDFHHQNRLP